MNMNMNIYKVLEQTIDTGTRIEGVECNMYMFKSKKKQWNLHMD